MSQTDELRGVAYHEAGHAVASYYLGRGIRKVSILSIDDSKGRVSHPPREDTYEDQLADAESTAAFGGFVDGSLRRRVEIDAMIGLAGGLVMQLLTGKSEYEVGAGVFLPTDEEASAFLRKIGWDPKEFDESAGIILGGDLRRVFESLSSISGSDDEALAYLDWLMERTKNLIRLPGFIEAVRALADKLLDEREINGRIAKDIIMATREAFFKGLGRDFRPMGS